MHNRAFPQGAHMPEDKSRWSLDYWHIPLFVCVLLVWTAALSVVAPLLRAQHQTRFFLSDQNAASRNDSTEAKSYALDSPSLGLLDDYPSKPTYLSNESSSSDNWDACYPGSEEGWDQHIRLGDMKKPPIFRGQSLLDDVEPIINARCPLECSGNGLCNQQGKCSCELGFTGKSCEKKLKKVGNQTKLEYTPMDGEHFAAEYNCHAKDHEKVINEDLKPWKKSGISKELIEESVRLKFRCLIMQIINNTAYRATKKTSTPLRWLSFKKLLVNLIRRNPLPNLEFVMCFDDRPLSMYPDMWPIFSYYKSLAHSDILMPGSFHYDEFLGTSDFRLYLESSKYPWSKKTEKCIWRGTANGNWKGFPYSVETFPYFPRPRLVQISNQTPDLVDAGFTGTYTQKPEVLKLMEPYMKKRIPMKEQLNSKYMIVIDGNGSSDRYHAYLESGSVVVKPTGPYYEFFHSWPIPYKHYIPVKYDLSDLVYKLQWAKKHDEYTKRISKHSVSWSRNHLRLEEIYCYLWRLLNNYSKLLNYNVTLREEAIIISEFDGS